MSNVRPSRCTFSSLKGTVCVILSDPPCKNANSRFTTVILKPKSDKNCKRKRTVVNLALLSSPGMSLEITLVFP